MASPHVAVVAFPFISHGPKLLTLARALGAAAPSATFSFLSTQDSLARLGGYAVPANMNLVEVSWAEWDKTKIPVPRQIELFLDGAEDGVGSGRRLTRPRQWPAARG
jgi:anthocyanidin 3-O-glucosyltransferase